MVVFDNDSNGMSSNEYSAILGRDCVKHVLQFILDDDCNDDKMALCVSQHIKSLPLRYADAAGFVIFDLKNTPMKKMFPNNFIEIEGTMTDKDRKAAEWVLSEFGTNKPISQNTWFIADTHFFHSNIIRYSGKNAAGEVVVTEKDVYNMNQAIIGNWNKVVGKDDVVWHLGDFSFGKKDNVKRVLSQLNGKINLVKGNHDRESLKFYYDAGFNAVYDHPVLLNNYVILSHIPMPFLNKNTPFFNIAGHVHDSAAYQTWSPVQCIVSVERHNYAPVSWKTIEENYKRMQKEGI